MNDALKVNQEQIVSALFGLAVGDALGVPVENESRVSLKQNPVHNMREFGTHNQMAGNWSDDSSMTFCLAESLCKGYDLEDIARKFVDWIFNGTWCAGDEAFDYGNVTYKALNRLHNLMQLHRKINPKKGKHEMECSNGSLMRTLPLAFFMMNLPVEERFRITDEVSRLTHGHPRPSLACHIYLEFARELIIGFSKQEAYRNMQQKVNEFIPTIADLQAEAPHFRRILMENISLLSENEIQSNGYVVHTLEASLWCLLKYDNFKDTILAAVNLGADTDTTAAVTGGLAGLMYGYEQIPKEWIDVLARKEDIEDLGKRLALVI